MKFSEIYSVIEECVRHKVAFAAYALPHSDDYCFFEDTSPQAGTKADLNSFSGFAAGFFGKDQPLYSVGNFREEGTELCFEKYNSKETANTVSPTTDHDLYVAKLCSLIAGFGSLEEKAVVSRVLNVESRKSPVCVAWDYFRDQKSCFRHIYYMPVTGLWFGATPELLIEYRKSAGEFRTMSLAGTRLCGGQSPWDDKNIHEHNLVTRHIVDVFGDMGLDPVVGEATAVKFGRVEHLCHEITGRGVADMNDLYSRLNPTPAVCGYPHELALERIAQAETHERRCYGGAIAVASDDVIKLFVNLRCASVSELPDGSYSYGLYAGGGINAMSDPEDEWREAGLKMQPLYEAVTGSRMTVDV